MPLEFHADALGDATGESTGGVERTPQELISGIAVGLDLKLYRMVVSVLAVQCYLSSFGDIRFSHFPVPFLGGSWAPRYIPCRDPQPGHRFPDPAMDQL